MAQSPASQNAALLRRIEQYVARLARLLSTGQGSLAELAAQVEGSFPDGQFFFDSFPELRARATALAQQLASKMETVVLSATSAEWANANKGLDNLVGETLKQVGITAKTDLTDAMMGRYFNNHSSALRAYQERSWNGLDLSGRLWRTADQAKVEVELARSIAEGKSAAEISRSIKQYLNEPDKLFRRVRDKYGELHLSKNAEAYHPGLGIYRSSRANAMRLARTEVNQAYRLAEWERYQDLDFVVGFEIRRSNHAPLFDCKVCEALKGPYPKEFMWYGWHPQCMCFMVPILKTLDELASDTQQVFAGGEYSNDSVNKVETTPPGFNKWVYDNRDRIKASYGKKSLPNFLADNYYGFVSKAISDYTKLGTKVRSLTELVGGYRFLADESPVLKSLYESLDAETDRNKALSLIEQIQHKASVKTRWDLRSATDGLEYVGEKHNTLAMYGTSMTKDLRADIIRFRDPNTGIQFGYQVGYRPDKAFSAKEAATQMAKIPEPIRKGVDSIDFMYVKNPQDAYWEKTYKMKNFTSEATDGGNVHFWNGYPTGNEDFLRSMAHESGHKFDFRLGLTKSSDFTNKANDWYQICYKDWQETGGGKEGFKRHVFHVSEYSYTSQSLSEDFAESVRLYITDRKNFKECFPNRFAFIDKAVKGKDITLSSSLGTEMPNAPTAQAIKRNRKAANKALADSLKKDSRFTDVKYNTHSGGVKASEIGHNVETDPKAKRYFATATSKGFTGKELEVVCQEGAYNSGHSLVFANEGKAIAGKKLASLDCWYDGVRMDIASMTENNKHTLANKLADKRAQLISFNARKDITTKADSLIVYFYDKSWYSEKYVRDNIKYFKKHLLRGRSSGPLKTIHCLVRTGEGLVDYTFSI